MSKVIGIDISKATFDVAYQRQNEKLCHYKFTNNTKGFKSFIRHVVQDDHCVMEASGPYYLFLAHFLFNHGIHVSVVNPLQVKHFVRMRMTRAKTDKKDAQMIMKYGQGESPGLWQPDEQHVSHLHQINTAIEGLHKHASMVHNQIEAFTHIPDKDLQVIKMLRSLLRNLEGKIEKLENRMTEIAQQHYSNTCKSLTSIPGIGLKTSIMLIAITDNFRKFDSSKKLAAYVGLAPRIFESGTSVKGKGHITKMGDRHIRKLLYMCAWSAKRNNPQCKQMYERLSQRGKPEKVIKVAMANKLLRQAYAIGSGLATYEKNYEIKLVS